MKHIIPTLKFLFLISLFTMLSCSKDDGNGGPNEPQIPEEEVVNGELNIISTGETSDWTSSNVEALWDTIQNSLTIRSTATNGDIITIFINNPSQSAFPLSPQSDDYSTFYDSNVAVTANTQSNDDIPATGSLFSLTTFDLENLTVSGEGSITWLLIGPGPSDDAPYANISTISFSNITIEKIGVLPPFTFSGTYFTSTGEEVDWTASNAYGQWEENVVTIIAQGANGDLLTMKLPHYIFNLGEFSFFTHIFEGNDDLYATFYQESTQETGTTQLNDIEPIISSMDIWETTTYSENMISGSVLISFGIANPGEDDDQFFGVLQVSFYNIYIFE